MTLVDSEPDLMDLESEDDDPRQVMEAEIFFFGGGDFMKFVKSIKKNLILIGFKINVFVKVYLGALLSPGVFKATTLFV